MRAISIFCSAVLAVSLGSALAEGPGGPFHIVLDAGHDPSDPGLQIGPLFEKDLTLALAQAVAARLTSQTGVETVLTRKGDYPLSFDERRRVANTHEPGIFLSLHIASATRIYLLSGISSPESGRFLKMGQAHLERSPESLAFAGFLQEELLPSLPDTKTEVTFLTLAPIAGIRIPAVLIETPPLTEPAKADFADALSRAVDRFRNEGKDPSP